MRARAILKWRAPWINDVETRVRLGQPQDGHGLHGRLYGYVYLPFVI